MPRSPGLDALLDRHARALGRRLKRSRVFRMTLRRQVAGQTYSEVLRRLSPPNRFRDDLSVDGAWRFSEAFDGTRGWYRDKNHASPAEASGLALASNRWTGARLDYLQPLWHMARLGCGLQDCGPQPNALGRVHQAVRIAMLDHFAETVFIDDQGRIAGHRLDLPEAADDERELEVCVNEWREHEGLLHPVLSTVLDRRTGETVAEIIVDSAASEPLTAGVFDLTAE